MKFKSYKTPGGSQAYRHGKIGVAVIPIKTESGVHALEDVILVRDNESRPEVQQVIAQLRIPRSHDDFVKAGQLDEWLGVTTRLLLEKLVSNNDANVRAAQYISEQFIGINTGVKHA